MFRPTRGDRWSEQAMFYYCIQPAKNATNSCFFVGTSAVVRRAAIENIGGFATGTATEDIHTSLRLHSRGWRSVYVPEPLAFGLEAVNLTEYYRQRRRWAAGSLGLLFRSADSPLCIRGLSLAQRLNYVSATLAHMQGFQRLFYVAVPVLTILTLRSPVTVPFGWYSLALLTFLSTSWWIAHRYGRGTFHLLHNEVNNLVVFLPQVVGAHGIVRVQKKFVVSGKTANRAGGRVLRLLYLAFLTVCVACCARAAQLMLAGTAPGIVGFSACFLAGNAFLMTYFLRFLYRYERRTDRPPYARLVPARKYAFVVRRATR
jgi:hypothetical protein